MTAPPTTSEWPLMNLVVEWTTKSAPSLIGFCSAGDRKVLSQTTLAPAAWARVQMSATSTRRSRGLEGVSTRTSLGLQRKRRLKRDGIALIDQQQLEMPLLGAGVQQATGAAVTVVRRDQQVARLQQGQGQVDGGHAGGGDDGARAAFQFGQGFGQDVAGRVARAAVVVLPLLLEAGEGIVGRQIERRHDRAVGRVRIHARAGGDGVRIGGTGSHALMSLKAARRMSPTKASSFRKASWPKREGASTKRHRSATARPVRGCRRSAPDGRR